VTKAKDNLVTAVAEALASTAMRTKENDFQSHQFRFYSLPHDARFQHVERAKTIVDRLLMEGAVQLPVETSA
jgi:hypothetical protein